MADITLQFSTLNVSVQPTDIVYACLLDEGQAGVNTSIQSMPLRDTKPFPIGEVTTINHATNVIVVDDTGYMYPTLHEGHYFFFSKDRRANISGILGYYALIEYRNYSKKQAEMFATGVDFSLYNKFQKESNLNQVKNIYYFGNINYHLDLDLYNQLAEKYNIHCIGILNPIIKKKLSKKIIIHEPVNQIELPQLLNKADCIALLYQKTAFTDGVIPAKFYEAIATLKPVIISGLDECLEFSNIVYNINGSYQKFEDVINNMTTRFTEERKANQLKLAKSADWSNRAKALLDICEQNLN